MKEYIEALVDFYNQYKIYVLIHTIITLLLIVSLIGTDNTLLLDIILGFATILSAIISIISLIDNPRADRPVKGFKALHSKMIKEMNRLASVPRCEIESNSLVTLSYTPAFGNISEPESFEPYKQILNDLIEHGIKVTIICYNKEKREQFHLHWARTRTAKESTDRESKRQKLMEKWEKQASDIIKKVRDRFGYDAVREFGDIHPIFVFASTKVAFSYTMKEDTEQRKNDIVGTETKNLETVKFINDSLQTYLTSSPSLLRKLDPLLSEDDKAGAKKLMERIVGEARKKRDSIGTIDVLIAYGGGKDSTWALAFIRYVQELVRLSQRKTFTLHVVTYIHTGMVKSVIENIKSVYKNLELKKTDEVKMYFTTGDGTKIDEQEILDGENYRLPEKHIKQSKREILLLGHLSKGLGRHTFCYTCNINMIMAIVSYILEKFGERGRIDFVVTGDSKEEKDLYLLWLNRLFTKIYPDSKDSLIVNISKLKQDFNEFIMNDKRTNGKRPAKVDEYPEFLEIFHHTNYPFALHKEPMEEIGFKLDLDSLNFTESDCKYPAVMAYLADVRGEIKIHIESIKKLMEHKHFSIDMIETAVKEYLPGISNKKRGDIITFCRDSLGITEKQLNSMVASPFLNKAENLDSFLREKELSLDKTDIVGYIKEPDKFSEKRTAIDEFFQEYIGLSVSDIRLIYEQISLEKSDSILSKISADDPYVERNAEGKAIISGR